MLRKRWPNRIVSDDGFEVRVESRGTIVYCEGDRKLVTASELLVADEGLLLYRNSLANWTVPQGEVIPQVKREAIERNIESALTLRRLKLTVI